MKITIEPETKEEIKAKIEKIIYENVYEFALTGNGVQKLFPYSICRLHTDSSRDNFELLGKLAEATERLKAYVKR